MPERQLVHQSERRTTQDRKLAARLQPATSPQFAGLLAAGRICTCTSGDAVMRKASTGMLEQRTQTRLLRNGPVVRKHERCSKFPEHRFFCFLMVRSLGLNANIRSSGGSQRSSQTGAENVHHTFQVVDDPRQAHLRLCSSTTTQKESRMTEDVAFQSCERMFHSRSA
jgi:hypothetical protein